MPKYTQDILCELFHHINKETIISVLVSCGKINFYLKMETLKRPHKN